MEHHITLSNDRKLVLVEEGNCLVLATVDQDEKIGYYLLKIDEEGIFVYPNSGSSCMDITEALVPDDAPEPSILDSAKAYNDETEIDPYVYEVRCFCDKDGHLLRDPQGGLVSYVVTTQATMREANAALKRAQAAFNAAKVRVPQGYLTVRPVLKPKFKRTNQE